MNQALDLPDFIISNPDEAGPAASRRCWASNARAIGMVLDDDGVKPTSIQISLDGGAFVPVTQVDGSGISVRWQHELSALGGGPQHPAAARQDIYDASEYHATW